MFEIEIALKTEIEKIFTNIYVQKRWKKENFEDQFEKIQNVVSGGEVRVCAVEYKMMKNTEK